MPKLENGFTRIANEILEALLAAGMTGIEWEVVGVVIRLTYGWNRASAPISYGIMAKLTGRSRRNLIKAVAQLKERKILHVKGESIGRGYAKPNVYSIHPSLTKGVVTHRSPTRRKPVKRKKMDKQKRDGGVVTHRSLVVKTVKDGDLQVTRGGDLEVTQIKTLYKDINKDTLSGEVVAYWNSKCNRHGPHGLSPILTMTPEREARLWNRLCEPVFAERWREIIDRMTQCDVLTGRSDSGFRATIDWLIRNSTNYLKVLEGSLVSAAGRAREKAAAAEEERKKQDEKERLERERLAQESEERRSTGKKIDLVGQFKEAAARERKKGGD